MRRLTASLCLWLMLSSVGWAAPILTPKVVPFDPAIGSTSVWDVRTTGLDTNGGAFDPGVGSPGTDESQANTGTAITCTLTGSGTTATCVPAITSTTHGPGNFIFFASGTGCTTTRPFEILSQSAGTATFDASVGTATDVCVGVIGGGFLTIAQAYSKAINNNTVFVKGGGTYTITSSLVPPCLATIGYNSSHSVGTAGTAVNVASDFQGASQATIEANRPLITTATNSTPIFYHTANCGGQPPLVFQYLALSNTAGTRSYGIANNGAANPHGLIDDVSFTGFSEAICGDGSACTAWNDLNIRRCEITTSTTEAIYNNGNTYVQDCNIHDNNVGAHELVYNAGSNNALIVTRTIFDSNTLTGANGIVVQGGNNALLAVRDSVFYNTAGASAYGVLGSSGTTSLQVENTIFYGNAGYGIGTNSGVMPASFCSFCAFGSNTGPYLGNINSGNEITLGSNNPFVSASGHNFAINPASTGGALLYQLGFPGVMPAQNSAFYTTVGIGPPQASVGGSVTPYSY